MTGPFIDSIGIISGSCLGALFGRKIPKTIQEKLPLVFGCISMGIGVSMIVKIHNLTPVVLALLIGTILGMLCRLEEGVNNFGSLSRRIVERLFKPPGNGITDEIFAEKFAAMVVLFGFSGVSFMGAVTEGLTGDFTLLTVKALLDFFTAAIFAISLGFALASTFVIQLTVQTILLFAAMQIAPYMNEIVMGDFSAVGGIIMLATGFNICGLLQFPLTSMLPSLILIIPLSTFWMNHFAA